MNKEEITYISFRGFQLFLKVKNASSQLFDGFNVKSSNLT